MTHAPDAFELEAVNVLFTFIINRDSPLAE